MLTDLKYFETPIIFHAIVHAQKNPMNPPKFAAFMLLFNEQSYLKPRWATISLQKNFLQLQGAVKTWPLA